MRELYFLMNQLIAKLIHQPSTNLKTNLSTTTQSIKTNKLSLAFRLTLGLVLFSAVLIGINHQSKALAEVNNNYSWTQRKNGFVGDQMSWSSITSSANGSKLAAVDGNNGSIYTSTDSGATWTEQTAAGSRDWSSITSSADGTKLAAATYGGSIYTSTDSGATWSEQTAAGSRNWRSITSSADGTKLVAVVSGGSIYTSADSGTTWTEQTAAGSRYWYSITSSADGTKLAAVVSGGSIYTGSIEGEVVDPPTPPPSSNTAQLTTPTSPLSTFSLKPVSLTTPTGTTINSSSTVPESSLVTQDNNNQYPLGLVNFSFTTNQSSNQVVLNFITDLTPNQVTPRKYNSNTNTYNNLPTSANPTITETTIDNKHALTLTYTLIDNGELDLDPTTGIVKDPVGLAVSNQTYDQLANTGTNNTLPIATAISMVTIASGIWVLSKRKKSYSSLG